MNYFKQFIEKLLTKKVKTPLGRWHTEKCLKKLEYKIYLSNIDNSYTNK